MVLFDQLQLHKNEFLVGIIPEALSSLTTTEVADPNAAFVWDSRVPNKVKNICLPLLQWAA
jgi:hypothetical protein